MASRGPTLINLPPPPSDPATPSELGPGTPNSTTTSLSALSVVAIKDGAVGHGARGGSTSVGTLEAERADRISRLAGLERVATARAPGQNPLNPGGAPGPGYFDNPVPQIKERSTVGSASATGSVGGRTTWASESVDYDADKMSEDGVSSTGAVSEENASLVGFGEGASSTISGPISSNAQRGVMARQSAAASPITPRSGTFPTFPSNTTMTGVGSTDPRMMDGITYDSHIVDTTMSPAPPVDQPPFQGATSQGAELAESIMRDRIVDTGTRRSMNAPDNGQLGKFAFERD